MRVLVTGTTGMLGRGVALALAARGDRVTVLQRRPAGLGLPEVLTDVSDTAAVRAAVTGHDAVVHLAAKVNVVGPEAEYLRVNVHGTRAVVEACATAGVQRLVHVSSPSVAHSGSSLVGCGADPADPATARGPYARSKALAEHVALGADCGELAVVAIRPHLVWGPGDTQLIARIVDRARRGRLPLVGSGAALIDTTYVTNAVDALLAALDRCLEGRGQALVVTNGEPRPVAESSPPCAGRRVCVSRPGTYPCGSPTSPERRSSLCGRCAPASRLRTRRMMIPRSPDSWSSSCRRRTGSISGSPARSCNGNHGFPWMRVLPSWSAGT